MLEMLCPKCGSPVGDTASLCENCQSEFQESEAFASDLLPDPENTKVRHGDTKPTSGHILYDETDQITIAGPLARILAFIVDTTAVYLFLSLVVLILASLDFELPKSLVSMFSFAVLEIDFNSLADTPLTKDLATDAAICILAMFLAGWFYFAPFESSMLRGTPGKLLFGLRAWSVTGERLSFFQSTARHFGKLLSLLPFGLGFFFAFFNQRGQALHDLVSESIIVRANKLSFFRLVFSLLFSATFCGGVAFLLNSSAKVLDEKTDKYDPQSAAHLAEYINFREKQKQQQEKERKLTEGQPVNGSLRGKKFEMDKALYSASTLELRMGKGFFPKLGLKIFLPLSKNSLPENQVFHFSPDSRQNFPAITLSWMKPGSRVPNHDNFGNHRRYSMELEFGKRVGNQINGKLKITLPDEWKSSVEGVFEAQIAN